MLDLFTFFMHGTSNFLISFESDFVGLAVGHHLGDLSLHIVKWDFKTRKGWEIRLLGKEGGKYLICQISFVYLLFFLNLKI